MFTLLENEPLNWPLFRVVTPAGFEWVRLIDVVGKYMRVAAISNNKSGLVRLRNVRHVVIEQVHPEDRDVIASLLESHSGAKIELGTDITQSGFPGV